MEQPTLPTRKRFLKKAALAFSGVFGAAGIATASGRELVPGPGGSVKRASGAPRIRAAAGTVARGSVR